MLGKIDFYPSQRGIRVFAVTLLIAAFLFAAVFFLLGKTVIALPIAAVGTLLAVISYLSSFVGLWVYRLWMGITFVLGTIISPILAALIFFLFITPIGLVMRISGKDTLQLKCPRNSSTCFSDHESLSDLDRFLRQF